MRRYLQATRLRPGPPGRTKHAIGLPTELGGDPVQMAEPTFVAVSQTDEGYFVERYADTRESAGDTWHRTRADAVDQTDWEYGARVGGWVILAAETNDVEAVVAQLAHVTFTDAD
jgi:hypothetical protein